MLSGVIFKMKINEDVAEGIVFTGNNIVYAKAIRKPNVNTKIVKEIWFKGSVQDSLDLLNKNV